MNALVNILAGYWYLIGGVIGFAVIMYGFVRWRRRQPKEPTPSRLTARERKYVAVFLGLLLFLFALGAVLDATGP